ncbi:MAG: sigma-70 family RNA polymerase sigma factor [Actinomycetota bacterium]|nr:sigma-70 family RNA polymerase sigma factor [Actinomycetota bacterium]
MEATFAASAQSDLEYIVQRRHTPPAPARRTAHRNDAIDGAALTFLVQAAAGGDQSAWNILVERFASTVWAIARGHRLNSADAADVFQTTWLRLLEHLDRIEHPERVGAWLATTARRECLRLLRMAGRQVPNGDDFDVLPDPSSNRSPDRDLVTNERRELVNQLVDQLPARSQLLLRLLSADSPLSYREISEALSMPIGSIGPTRARALEQLRRIALASGLDLEDVFVA